ncbi:MAG: outer membrane protein assembly factor BamB family protein [Planctomycetota bacterium]|jgi:outer membrane protein assembly factor BamB
MSGKARGFCLAVLICGALAGAARAGSWPAYRGDAGRTAYCAEQPPAKLSLRWTFKPVHPPAPAWPDDPRMSFDRAQHVVADGERVYFGSSADCRLYALDAATGRERWSFFTGAPVRFAPVLWKDRVLAVSDDGYIYCLSAAEGKLVWKKRPGPSDRMVLGNGRMISKWPARGGPALVGDVVYFAAGIWPSDGVYVCALKAADGGQVWVNDQSGSAVQVQPHSGASAKSGVCPHGYLAVSGDRVFVPNGRGVAAGLNRADGKLAYFRLGGSKGGTPLAAVDSVFFSSGSAFAAADGKKLTGWLDPRLLAASPKLIFHHYRGKLAAIDRAEPLVTKEVKSGKRTRKVKSWNTAWSAEWKRKGAAMILAGRTLFLAGEGTVAAFDTGTRKETWSAELQGSAAGLAFAAGRLYVSTLEGPIYCLAAGGGGPATIEPPKAVNPYGGGGNFAAAAAEIVKAAGVVKGYCLDLGCGQGQLAYELAKRTELHVYGVEKCPQTAAAARKKLAAAGLYGTRVTVLQGDPAKTDFPNYFADLVVSGNSLAGAGVCPKETLRCQRPYGGVACLGRPGSMKKSVRGPLKGAGSWTHQYAGPGNTVCSDDELVKGPLTMLWFGSPRQVTANRHGRPPAPLSADGRLFVQGLNDVRAYSAHNGRLLWTLPLEGITKPYDQEHLVGVAATGSNICLGKDSLFLHTKEKCLRIEAATGRKLGEFPAPAGADGKPGTWGYIACDGGILFGSLADAEHVVHYAYGRSNMKALLSESRELFALDAATGKLKWRHKAESSIRHNAVAVGGGSVYLIDRPRAAGDLLSYKPKKGEKTPAHPPGKLVALDAATGREKWRKTENIYGTVLALSVKHDALLMCYQPTRFRLRSETGGRFAAYRASDGELLHDTKASYRSRPVINDRLIYTDPYAWDLLSGKQKKGWRLKRSYGCGTIAGGRHVLTFRSATLGYHDLLKNECPVSYGPIRSGCWINAIPVGGLLLVPDYTDRCGCSYLIKTSLALEPGG